MTEIRNHSLWNRTRRNLDQSAKLNNRGASLTKRKTKKQRTVGTEDHNNKKPSHFVNSQSVLTKRKKIREDEKRRKKNKNTKSPDENKQLKKEDIQKRLP